MQDIEPAGENDSLANSIRGNAQITTTPQSVILTGLQNHRLVTVYKTKLDTVRNREKSYSSYGYSYSYEEDKYGSVTHFMPSINILYGYNLLNIAHYDLKNEKLNYFFERPVLVKTLYYPSFIQDSVDKKQVNRHYYLVSAYDEDTNKDTLINKKNCAGSTISIQTAR